MSTTVSEVQGAAPLQITQEKFDQLLSERLDAILPRKIQEINDSKTPSMALIATKGTLDWAYPPFILASTAAALGWNVTIFFTFYALILLKKKIDIQVSPLGNPAMPMKMPMGPKWFRSIQWNIPNIIQANIPWYETIATTLMKKTVKNVGVADVQELRDLCLEADVKMVACNMTVELFGFSKSDFIPEVTEYVGAASFLPVAKDSDVTIFI